MIWSYGWQWYILNRFKIKHQNSRLCRFSCCLKRYAYNIRLYGGHHLKLSTRVQKLRAVSFEILRGWQNRSQPKIKMCESINKNNTKTNIYLEGSRIFHSVPSPPPPGESQNGVNLVKVGRRLASPPHVLRPPFSPWNSLEVACDKIYVFSYLPGPSLVYVL